MQDAQKRRLSDRCGGSVTLGAVLSVVEAPIEYQLVGVHQSRAIAVNANLTFTYLIGTDKQSIRKEPQKHKGATV